MQDFRHDPKKEDDTQKLVSAAHYFLRALQGVRIADESVKLPQCPISMLDINNTSQDDIVWNKLLDSLAQGRGTFQEPDGDVAQVIRFVLTLAEDPYQPPTEWADEVKKRFVQQARKERRSERR